MRRCSVVIIDLYGMFRVWTDTRNTAARNAVMFGLIEFTPLGQGCAVGLQPPLFSYLIRLEKIFSELLWWILGFCIQSVFN